MSFTVVRFVRFRLGIVPLIRLRENMPQRRSRKRPFTPVRELAKSLSRTYRNPCPRLTEILSGNSRNTQNNCSGHPLDRFMSCPLGTISKRSRLEVGLEDRLQYELERTLHHAIPDRRNRKDADFAPVLRYFLPPGRERYICALIEFVRNPLEESIYALRFDGREGHPVTSRSPIVVSSQRIRLA